METVISSYLSGLEFGEMQTFKNMGVVPLFHSVNHSPRYLGLGHAVEKGLLAITEVSHEGTVPELKVMNKAEIPILLLDGEELAGAKQNRIITTTILLRKKSENIIPVNCTEQGRWSYASKEFRESGNIMSRTLRRRNVSSVAHSLGESRAFRGDQGAIWEGIRHLSEEAAVHSETGAMRDVFEAKTKDLGGYLSAFPHLPKQKGVLVIIGGCVVGFDILSLDTVYETIHPKLVKSYAMDALLQEAGKGDQSSIDTAKVFVEKVSGCTEKKYKSIGHGWDHRFQGEKIVGSALVSRGKVIHMAFFAAEEGDRVGRMSTASQRRSFRAG